MQYAYGDMFEEPHTAYWRLKKTERQQVLPHPPGDRNCRVATANFPHDSAEALRHPIAGMWLTMGRHFSFVSAIVAPGPPSDNTGVLKRVDRYKCSHLAESSGGMYS